MGAVLLLVTALSVLFIGWIASSVVRGCSVLRVTGTNESSLSGIYIKRDVNIDNNRRSVYVQKNGNHTICAVSKVRWIVTSAARCDTTGARMFIDDVSPEPHRVKGPWKECIPDANGRCWRETPSIVVACNENENTLKTDKEDKRQKMESGISQNKQSNRNKNKTNLESECMQLRLVNVTSSGNIRYVGDYVKANFSCHEKYVYYKTNAYIIYWAGQWRIHDHNEPCTVRTGDLRMRAVAGTPRYINPDDDSWTEWNGSEYVSSEARLVCLHNIDETIEKTSTRQPGVWLYWLAALAGVTIVVIISVMIAAKIKTPNCHKSNDIRATPTVSYDNNVSRDDASPDELMIIDNAIYRHHTCAST